MSNIADLIKAAGPNAAKLEFPTDQWGFTSGLKKEVLKAASAVQGQTDKHDLLVGTILVLLAHIKARKDDDAAFRVRRLNIQAAAELERRPREATGGAVRSTAVTTERTNG